MNVSNTQSPQICSKVFGIAQLPICIYWFKFLAFQKKLLQGIWTKYITLNGDYSIAMAIKSGI